MKQMEKGQVALVMLLVMVVMLTLGVSVVQRGVTDVRISQQEEDSARAFQAAETGVEEALSGLVSVTGQVGEDASYTANITEGGNEGFVSGQPVEAGETVLVDLAGSDNVDDLDIYFMEKNRDDCDTDPAAVEVEKIYTVGVNTRVKRLAYDTVAGTRGNNFSDIGSGSFSFQGKTFCAKVRIGIGNSDIQVRIRPVYNRAVIGINPRPDNAVLAVQYLKVGAVGKIESGVTRAVDVQRTLPQLPAIFDYAVFSGGGIVKGE